MAKGEIIWNQLYFKGWTLSQDLAAKILSIDNTGKIVSRPAIDTSAFMSSALTDSYIFVGNASNIAEGVPVTGDIILANNGAVSIADNVIVDSDISATAAIALSKLNGLTPSRVVVTSNLGVLQASTKTTTDLTYLDATSSIQTQLNTKLAATITSPVTGDMIRYSGSAWVNFPVGTNGFVLTVSAGVPTWAAAAAGNLPVGGTTGQYLNKIDATNYNAQWSTLTVAKITDLTASAAELNIMDGVTTDFTHINYLTDVTSLIQAQINAKQATITGGASTIVSSNLSTNLVLVSDGSGKVIVSTVSTTILGYIGGLTSSAQAQLDSKLTKSLSQNALWVGNGSNIAVELSPGTTGYVLTSVGGVPTWQPASGGGGGGIAGPGSSTDNAVVRWDGVLGTVVQDSSMLVGDTGIVTGATWNANKIGLAYGGTNADLSGTGGTSNYLKQASVGAAITVGTIPASDIASGAALTRVSDTNVTLTLGGAPTTALLTASSITVGWAGTLAYARFVDGAGLSVVGRATNSAGVQADITAGTDAHVLRRSGTSIGFGTIGDASITALAFGKLTGLPTTLAGYGILDAANKYWTLNPQSGTTYTFVLTDKDTVLVQATNAAASSFTIPPNASVAYPTGSQIALTWDGVGQPSFVAGAGVTLNSSSGDLTVPSRYSIAIATKIATNTWYVWNGSAFAAQSANVVFAGPTSGGAAVPTFRALVAADIGTIAVANGGTNITSYVAGDILYASGTTTLSTLAIGTTGQILYVTGGIPAWKSEVSITLGKTDDIGSLTANFELLSSVANNKTSTYFSNNVAASWNGASASTNVLQSVPNTGTILVRGTFVGVQTSGTAGSTGFHYVFERAFRRTGSTTTAIGAATVTSSSNDTGLTFSTVPTFSTSGSNINFDRQLSATTITFNVLLKIEVTEVV